jgi:ATP-dependent Clp protease protease subunit
MNSSLKNHHLGEVAFRLEAKKSESAPNETDLYLYGDIGDSWWGDTITARNVINALSEIETDVINAHIQSYGGEVFEGITISNLFKQSEKTINIYIDGIAASAATIIALGGDKIVMPANTQFMIHNPWTYAVGNADELEKVVNQLRKTEDSIIATYMEKFVGTEDELRELLEAEEFLTAEEALAYGFADEILETGNGIDAGDDIKARLMNKYGQKCPVEPKNNENKKNLLNNMANVFN